MNQAERFKLMLKNLSLNQIEFAKKIGLPLSKIRNISCEAQKLTPDIALEIEKKFGVDASWLAFGKQMPYAKFDLENGENQNYYIKYYEDIRASAGFGTDAIEMYSSQIITIPKSAISITINPSKIHAIKIIGDSMEPKISDGDVAFVEIGVEFVKDGCIYVMKIDEDIYIKRLYKSPENMYFIRSDNKEYPEFRVERNKVKIIGRVIYLLSQFGK